MQNNDKSQDNKLKIEKAFSDIHRQFQLLEDDIIKQLETKHNENIELYDTIKSTIESENEIINRILEKHSSLINSCTIDKVFNEESNQHIQIIKDNAQAKQLVQTKLDQQFGEYKEHSVEIDEKKIDEIFELLKQSFTFQSLYDNSNQDNDQYNQDDDQYNDIEKLTIQQYSNNNNNNATCNNDKTIHQ